MIALTITSITWGILGLIALMLYYYGKNIITLVIGTIFVSLFGIGGISFMFLNVLKEILGE